MVKNILEIDSIIKKFGGDNILSDIYLKCETGEIVGVLGRNGSGKTTLFKIIYGIEGAENKFIKLDKKILNTEKLIFKNISYLSQEHFIPKQFSVSKAIYLSVDNSRVKEFYDDEDIGCLKSKLIRELSTGELRYLETKIVLFNNSKFCLLDEPFSGLSPILVEKIEHLISKYSHTKGIIITDHNYESIMKISTKLILLKNGKTINISNRNELIEHGYLLNI